MLAAYLYFPPFFFTVYIHEMACLVDNLMEDEAEKERLQAKPTCFIIVGKPGVGKSTLAKKMAESWKCILIDDTDLLNTYINNKSQEGMELLSILSEGKSITDDVVLQLILARLNSPDVEHYGYVLSCLPFLSDDHQSVHKQLELVQNLKLPPDFIINIKCPDSDLVQRLSGLRTHPETGQSFSRDQWEREEEEYGREEEREMESDEEQTDEELSKERLDALLWMPENLPANSLDRIHLYNHSVLTQVKDYMEGYNPAFLLELDGNNTPEEQLQCVMSRLGSMAVRPVAVPVLLNLLEEETDTEDILRSLSSSQTAVPGFLWRWSRWGQTCPVALKEGKALTGSPEFSVGFQDKLYLLSSQEAHQKFLTNPREYLHPPMPRAPCRVSITGAPLTGKSTLCRLVAQHYGAVVLDVEELLQPVLAEAEEERLLKIKVVTTRFAIEKIQESNEDILVTENHPAVQEILLKTMNEAGKSVVHPIDLYAEVLEKHIKKVEEEKVWTGWVLDNFPRRLSDVEVLQKSEILPDIIVCLRHADTMVSEKKGNKDIRDRLLRNRKLLQQKKLEKLSSLPEVVEEADAGAPQEERESSDQEEISDYVLQLQQFDKEWEQMQIVLPTTCFEPEIDGKSPENLTQQIISEMEKSFQYQSHKLSDFDLEEEENYFKALVDQEEEEEENNSDISAAEEEDMHPKAKRLLGDTKHFCPVALKNHNVLHPCTDDIAARYRDRTFYFSSQEARDSFLQNPAHFVAHSEPLKPPALRIFMLGPKGSGKSSLSEELSQQLGLFHVQFIEMLQMMIVAKTKTRVSLVDEVVPWSDNFGDLEASIKKFSLGSEEQLEDRGSVQEQEESEEDMTAEEVAIKAYLSTGKPLSPQILDSVVEPFWKQEPYMSTGFILDGFPNSVEEVQFMLEQQLLPDVIVVLELDAAEVQKRLFPACLEKWRELSSRRKQQLRLLSELRRKRWEDDIAKKMAELKQAKDEDDADEEDEEDLEANLKEEFPFEEDDDLENIETEEAATQRLELEIENQFLTDEKNLSAVMESLSEHSIPQLAIDASRKLVTVLRQLQRRVQPLLTDRESLFQTCQPISSRLAKKLLLSSYKFPSGFGCSDPVQLYKDGDQIQPLLWPLDATYPLLFNQYVYLFATKENRDSFMSNPLKYLRQPKPSAKLPIKIAVIGPPKSGKTTVAESLAQNYRLERLSIGGCVNTVLNNQGHTELALKMKKYLTEGLVVPDELAIQCLTVALMSSTCSTKGYVLDDFPKTLKQAELMSSHRIIPTVVTELQMDFQEAQRRNLADKSCNKPHLLHESFEVLKMADYNYKKEAEHIRSHFLEHYQNFLVLDALKSKWWIWEKIVEEASLSMKSICTYLEKVQTGQATCVYRSGIAPAEVARRLGEFDQYCPVCLARHCHLVDCSGTTSLALVAEYRKLFYRLCGEKHLEEFLSSPDQFVPPGCPHVLPQPHLLPKKLTDIEVKSRFPQQAELKGFCPVTYWEGKQRYEALVQGKTKYAAEYRERLYIFESQQKQDTFMRTPETYWKQKLPKKVPSLCEPVLLTSLPSLGYMEQGMANPLIKAMTAAGCLKPKFPFLSARKSVLIYVGLYLKAFNPRSSEYSRQKYKRKLASFEEDCALIPYLSSKMNPPPVEFSVDLQFKLNKFLALEGAASVL
ncbi:adenylate kinase 9 isoform X1 [Oryzias melastigma]|uniref:adenylate kinase 9 isoform X1 n=1 Tax=Oryzias melastigma TaxID=30732 RepID=UPI000CF7DE10|nr:adenylate kinase 9 isoform X1 [Oryzias melastigma]